MESRNLLPQNTRTSLSIIKHSACKLVHEVNVFQDFYLIHMVHIFKPHNASKGTKPKHSS